ncbi:MAG: GIY-YIG nuclease family protein [Byssovorax sp.]
MARSPKKLPGGGRPTTADELAALARKVREGAAARPGVYRMISEDGGVLYVGKSKRLRARLMGYFRCEPREKGAKILRETREIEWSYTPNEFAALREELRLIKHLRPRFNVVSKRDAEHYAFLRITAGKAPKVTVARRRAAGDGIYYGPFIGPGIVADAARELADALGLRDCSDDVPIHYADQPPLIPLGLRAPSCIRHEIKRCLGPCVAGCTAAEYDERVALARAFLEGRSQGPIEHFQRLMEQAKDRQEYERAALYRDRLRRLEALREQLGRVRFALESLSFIYPVPGFGGDDRVYLIRRGTVRADLPAPRATPDRLALQRKVDEIYQPGEPPQAAIRVHEIDEILLVSTWFRRFPEELSRTWMPELS